MQHVEIPINRKALKINLDTNMYGSFAEIGGGQETSRHFFLAGGASNTIARTISAYDKKFSDLLYNKNVLVFRGSFRPITNVEKDIINTSIELFKKDEDYKPGNTFFFSEITLNNLLTEGELDERDFLERVNMLNDIGQSVMVSDIRDIKSNMSDQLRVKSSEVLKMIEKGDSKWEKFVPMVVAKTIKEKGLFGYSETKQD